MNKIPITLLTFFICLSLLLLVLLDREKNKTLYLLGRIAETYSVKPNNNYFENIPHDKLPNKNGRTGEYVFPK